MNNIPTLQNQEPYLKLLRARQQAFYRAGWLMWIQIVLTVVVPCVSAVAIMFLEWPALRPVLAIVALLITMTDICILDRWYRRAIKRAAKVAEQFDCKLLEIPWDQFTVGDQMEPEYIETVANDYKERTSDDRIIDWYPTSVSRVPLHFARIICQRANLHYDGRVREVYGALHLLFVSIILVTLLLAGLVRNLPMQDWALTFTAVTPFVIWGVREFFKQSDANEKSKDLKKEVGKLWADACSGHAAPDACLARSRQFQSGIYAWRSSNPLTIPFVYNYMRDKLEKEMSAGADALIGEVPPPKI